MKRSTKEGSSYPLIAKPRDTEPADSIIVVENIYAYPLLVRAVQSRPPNEDAIRGIRSGQRSLNIASPIIDSDRQATLFQEAGHS